MPAGLLQILFRTALQAPSGKNKQPWRWVMVSDGRRKDMVRLMHEGLAKMKASGHNTGSAERSF